MKSDAIFPLSNLKDMNRTYNSTNSILQNIQGAKLTHHQYLKEEEKHSNLSPISLKSGIESSQPPKKRESFSLALDPETWYPI